LRAGSIPVSGTQGLANHKQNSSQTSNHGNEPAIFPYIPRKRQERSGLLIDYLYLPAAQEAGDQIDFLILGENRVGILLADVSGKIPDDSTPVLKTVLRSNSTGLSAAATLRYLDQCLAESGTNGLTLTAFYAIFDQNKRLLHFASAGHLPMLVYRPSEGNIYLLNTCGAPLGEPSQPVESPAEPASPSANRIEGEKVALRQNDLLVLYSDGLLAARGADGEFFGRQRLIDFIAKYGELEPTAFLAELRNMLQKFTNGQNPNDDITVIALKNVLRDLEKQHPEACDCELAENFMNTVQEQAILEILRDEPQSQVEHILARLAEDEQNGLTQEQIENYVAQHGRWLRPWPARNGGYSGEQHQGFKRELQAASAARRLQDELLAAFPIRRLLNKRYEFRGCTPELTQALQYYNNRDFQKALDAFSAARESIKNSATVRSFFGNLYLLLDMHAHAKSEYQAALELDQRCTHALLALSYVALKEENYDAAIESLVTALRLNDDLPEFLAFLENLIAAVERRESRSEWLI